MTSAVATMRPARAEDLPALVALLADDMLGATREDPANPTSPAYRAAFATIDRDPNQLLAVAEIDGAVIGMLQLSFLHGLRRQGAWRGQIDAVRVAAPLRGRGIGRQMIRWAVDACRARGCRLVELTSDARRVDAHRFYRELGFAASHLGFKMIL